MPDSPEIREVATLQQTVSDLERELDSYRSTVRALDARCREYREALAGVMPLLYDSREFIRMPGREIVARVERAHRLLSPSSPSEGDRETKENA